MLFCALGTPPKSPFNDQTIDREHNFMLSTLFYTSDAADESQRVVLLSRLTIAQDIHLTL